MKSRFGKNLKRGLLATAALLTIAAGLSFFLFRSDPSWYHKVKLTEAEQAAGQQRLLDRLATLRNDVGRTQASTMSARLAAGRPTTQSAWPPFDIEITEAEVNGVLMRWSQTDPHVKAALAQFEEPHVRFLPGRVEIAGRSSEAGNSLVSIALSVEQATDGPRVELGRPWAGRLPLSRSLVEKPGEEGVAALRRGVPTHVPKSVVDSLAALVAGDAVEPIIPLASSLQGGGMLPAKVEKLEIEEGVLKATLRPIDESLSPSPP